MHSIQNQFTGSLAKQKGGSSSFTHRAAGHLARLAVLLTLAGNLPVAQAQEPYQTQAGRACIDAWTRHVSERLNSYNGTREHNGRKPWSINQYGLFVGQKMRSVSAPDNWGQFGSDRYQWMWATYSSEAKFPDWRNPNFNGAGLHGLRYFARQCVGGGSPGPGAVPGTGPGVGPGVGPGRGPSPAAEFLGCYQDRSARDLNGFQAPNSQGLTNAACIAECRRRGFAYAATQFRYACFCDYDYGSYGRATNCDMTCTGKANEICGGRWANSVYGTGLTPGSTTRREPMVGTDLPGSDYTSFWLDAADPGLCQARCRDDERCRAWTYVNPGVQGANAKCWLKNRVPNSRSSSCCVSGVERP